MSNEHTYEDWICEGCGKVIGYIEDGRAISCKPWSMSEDERELCEECWEKSEESKHLYVLKGLVKIDMK